MSSLDAIVEAVGKPYFRDEAVAIYHADCRDILPLIPPESIDLVLTDPPYGIGFDYGTGYKDSENGYREWLWPVLESCEVRMREGYVAVFQAAKWARKYAEWFPRQWRLLLIPKAFGQWMPSHIQARTDFVVYWPCGEPGKWETAATPRDWYLSTVTAMTNATDEYARPDHPAPRPLDTMRYLVDILCRPGGIILDPFLGSGTTARAAKDLGRYAIGIEIEEKYCEIAAKRMAQMVMPL